jgi:thymidylate synthase (FAD)
VEAMGHSMNDAAEAILDKEYKVLDHGFIRLVDYLGGDDRIVAAARVSYGKGTKTVREDQKLIQHLLRNEHMSPFEQVVFTFHVKMPIFVARQWVRHRTARINEISGRYSVMEDQFYTPEKKSICFQNPKDRQGRSEDEIVPPSIVDDVHSMLIESYAESYEKYKKMIDLNISREISRINLPLSLYTQMYWQIDLRNLMNFIQLRLDAHAQAEIREYAIVLAEIVKTVTPFAWEAFDEFMLSGKKLSKSQVREIGEALKNTHPELLKSLGITV